MATSHSKGPSQSMASFPRLSSEAGLLCGTATASGHRALGHTFGMSHVSHVAELSVFSVLGGLALRGLLAFLFGGLLPCACISFVPGQDTASGDKRAPVNCPWLSSQQGDFVRAA